MKIINKLLGNAFSYGALFAIFAGALAGVLFLVAFIIGGTAATELCVFIHKTYFPIIIKICSIATGCGLVHMYLQKQKALTLDGAEEK